MSRSYHKIYDERKLKGFVAPTLDMPGVWSIYNDERQKVAMIAPDGGQFNLMFYGKHAATTDYYTAASFGGAVQRAFKLGTAPLFKPKLPPEALDPMGAAMAEMNPDAQAAPARVCPSPGEPCANAAAAARANGGRNGAGIAAGIDAYLEGLLEDQGEARTKLYVLDLLISKARALRTNLM